MTHIAARRTSEPQMRFRLKRQDAENVVHVTAHAPGAPWPPGPDTRRDIVDDRNLRCPAAHALGHLMGEFGAIENDENFGIELDHCSRAFLYTLPDAREARNHVEQ